MAWRDAIQPEAMTCPCKNFSTGYVHLLWKSFGEEIEFEVKFGKKSDRVIRDSRGRTADALFMNMESVALAIEGSEINITEDNFVLTARCFQDTKERQLVARSNLQRLRCCVCHLRHDMETQILERRNSEYALLGSQRELESPRQQLLMANHWADQAQRERIHSCSELEMKSRLHQECYARSCQ